MNAATHGIVVSGQFDELAMEHCVPNLARSLEEHGVTAINLDFRSVDWFGLWPCLALCAILRAKKNPADHVTLHLPPRPVLARGGRNSALSFLFDWNVLHELHALGCRLTIGDDDLREISQQALTRFGYVPGVFSDRQIVPLTYFTSDKQVEQLVTGTTDALEELFGPFASDGGIRDAAVSENFLYELMSNVLEHSGVGGGYVCLRVTRPLSALNQAQRTREAVRRRNEPFSDLRTLYAMHPEAGFAELIVSDTGVGIAGTLTKSYAGMLAPKKRVAWMNTFKQKKNWIQPLLRFALQPESSRLSKNERIDKGKAPFTGLGAIWGAVNELEGMISFREADRRVSFFPSVRREICLHTRPSQEHPYMLAFPGCTIRVMFPVFGGQKTVSRYRVTLTEQHRNTTPEIDYVYMRAQGHTDRERPDDAAYDCSPMDILESIKEAPAAAAILLDLGNIALRKNVLFPIVAGASKLCELREGPFVLVNVTLHQAARVQAMFEEELELFKRRKGKAPYDPVHRPRLVCLALGRDLLPIWLGILSKAAQEELADFWNGKTCVNSPIGAELRRLQYVAHDGRPRFGPYEIASALRKPRGEHLRLAIDRAGGHTHEAVTLPTGEVVEEHVSILASIGDERVTGQIAADVLRELAFLEGEWLIGGTVAARAAWESSGLAEIVTGLRYHSPDVLTAGDESTPAHIQPGDKAIILLDAIYSGSLCRRLVNWCHHVGLQPSGVLALTDLRPRQTPYFEGTEIPVRSLTEYTIRRTTGNIECAQRADPVSGFVSRRNQRAYYLPGGALIPRNEHFSRVYARQMLNRKGYIVIGHYTNGQRHFAGILNLPRLLRYHSALRSSVVQRLSTLCSGADCLVYPENSDIRFLLPIIVQSLSPQAKAIRVIRARMPGDEYMYILPPEAERALEHAQTVAIVDDAMCTGTTTVDLIALVERRGQKEIRVGIVADYSRSAARDALMLAANRLREPRVVFESMFGIDLQPARSVTECHTCQAREAMRQYGAQANGSAFRMYCREVWRLLEPKLLSGREHHRPREGGLPEEAAGAPAPATVLDGEVMEALEALQEIDTLRKALAIYERATSARQLAVMTQQFGARAPLLAIGNVETDFVGAVLRKLQHLPAADRHLIVLGMAFWPRAMVYRHLGDILSTLSPRITDGCSAFALIVLLKRLWETSSDMERSEVKRLVNEASQNLNPKAHAAKSLYQTARAELGIIGWDGNDVSRHIHFVATRLRPYGREHHKLLRYGLTELIGTLRGEPWEDADLRTRLARNADAIDLLAELCGRVRFLQEMGELGRSEELDGWLVLAERSCRAWISVAIGTTKIGPGERESLYAGLDRLRTMMYSPGDSSLALLVRFLDEHHVWMDAFALQLRELADKTEGILIEVSEGFPGHAIFIQVHSTIVMLCHHVLLNAEHARGQASVDTVTIKVDGALGRPGRVNLQIEVLGQSKVDQERLNWGHSIAELALHIERYGGVVNVSQGRQATHVVYAFEFVRGETWKQDESAS